MDDPWRECRRSIAHHSKSFDLASRLFPGERRNEVAALYGWCRACDDAIDLSPPSEHGAAAKALHAKLLEIYDGVPQEDAVLSCFQQVVARRRIPIDYPLEFLRGMAMDVEEADYESLEDLLVYCWRVAGTVGLMMCHVMGVSDENAARHAAHLGIAMQLTNIARDVREDRLRGRVYLPADLLGQTAGEWLQSPASATAEGAGAASAGREATPEGVRQAVRRLLQEADRYYASADAGMRYLDPRSALAVRTARLVYAEIGREIERRGFDVMRGRTSVSRSRKLRLTFRALRRFASDGRLRSSRPPRAPALILRGPDAVRLP